KSHSAEQAFRTADRRLRREAGPHCGGCDHAGAPPWHELPHHGDAAGARRVPRRGPAVPHAWRMGNRLRPLLRRAARAADPSRHAAMRRLALPVLLLPVAAGAVEFDAGERAIIESLGPWPPAIERDASNRLSGREEAIAFGAVLFDEPRFSGNGQVSCRTCHDPAKGWGDGMPVSTGLQRVDRNAPGLMNVALHRWFGWDGASDSLWSATLRPFLNAREMGGSIAKTATVIRKDATLSRCFAKATGEDAAALDDEAVFVAAGKALAAFQETLISPRTPFDDFRDALLAGKASGYPEAARRGLKIFIGS